MTIPIGRLPMNWQPGTPHARQLAGRLLFLLGVAVFTSCLYRWMCPQWVAYRDGINALARNQPARALGDFDTALAGGATSSQLPLHVATALAKLGRRDEAIAQLEPLRRIFPPEESAASLLAGLYDAQRRPADALHVYFDALEMGMPRSANVLLHQGDLFRQIGRYRDAERLYLEVLAMNCPERSRAELHLAELYLWSARPRDALARYDALLRIDPTNRAARLGRARALAAADRRSEAIAEYRSLLLSP